ncbi:MAG: serine/threonine protein kinase [Fimbriiglobus sp.]
MTPPEQVPDLAIDIFLDWEERTRKGETLTLEEACETRPDLLDIVREVAARLKPTTPQSADTLPDEKPKPITVVSVPETPDNWKEVGYGTSCIVYKGHSQEFNIDLAYKVFHPQFLAHSENALKHLLYRFEQEAKVLARLKHEGIVRIYKTGIVNGQPTLSMEYLPGGTLAEAMPKLLSQGVPGMVSLFHKITEAMAHAHKEGIIHRDLKPTNILMNANGHPVVSDFGVAKMLRNLATEGATPRTPLKMKVATGTQQGFQPGTPVYMAPEQFDPALGEISAATDVFSLGMLFHEMLTGAEAVRLPRHVMRLSRSVPYKWRGILRKALATQAKDRYANAGELHVAIQKRLERSSLQTAIWVAVAVFVAGAVLALAYTKFATV